jgi:energy-coupling factor transport system ATP-binding protein
LTEPIITTRHLSYTYRTGPLVKVALNDVNLQIERGSCAAIIGVTGSGKSTLVQHFNGLLHPTSGSVIVDGIDTSARNADLPGLRQRVGMLFQLPEAQLFAHTVYADVAFGPRRMRLSKRDIRTRVFKALEIVGLPPHDFAQRSPFDLSGGQMRRVALAGVLATAPQVLVLDEPTTGLDADARLEFYAYLRRVQLEQGVTIILVSHDMTEVATLADWLYILHEGHLVRQGPPRRIFSEVDELRAWGLAAPPLSELLVLLRRRGMAVPTEVFTLDEALEALLTLYVERGADWRAQVGGPEKKHV